MRIEATGDSARGEAYAYARLVVEGERIVEADAPGMARPLSGLTLLEAAALPGETLAADAVANALAVVAPFVDGYASGSTPNPCMRCNGLFRFDQLVAFASRAGADVLWTGHYARSVERDGKTLVARAADPAKDQSYMLATVAPATLARVAFPLGEMTK